MGDKSKISWTDASWNPVTGCTRVSPGCAYCYAFALHDKRYAANVLFAKTWSGLHEEGTRKLRHSEGWMQWAERAGKPAEGWGQRARTLGMNLPWPKQYDRPFSQVQLMPERLDQPLRWKKPRRIFVNSMSDLFHEDVPDGFIAWVWITMARASQHTFQILTKRPERMREFVRRWQDLSGETGDFVGARGPEATRAKHPSGRGQLFADYLDQLAKPTGGEPPAGAAWPTFDWMEGVRWWRPTLPNVWLGVSVEDQARADERIPLLLETPAAVRFISAEPLLGPIELMSYTVPRAHFCGPAPRVEAVQYALADMAKAAGRRLGWSGLDWVIVGGESGKGWRPMDHAWARSIREQCRAAGVSYFGKQDSAHRNEVPLPGDLGDQEFPTPQ